MVILKFNHYRPSICDRTYCWCSTRVVRPYSVLHCSSRGSSHVEATLQIPEPLEKEKNLNQF
jgi:hypothetical protein